MKKINISFIKQSVTIKILRSQRGVALIMVMTAIVLLMVLYGEFTFESKVSRLKTTNILDKSQAKLLAESGIQISLARLRLYKESFNYLAKNPDLKNFIQPDLINQIWQIPFVYPIPIGPNASAVVKEEIKSFSDEIILNGNLQVTIQDLSNKLNLNLLRVDFKKNNPYSIDPDSLNSGSSSNPFFASDLSNESILQDVSVGQSLFFILSRLIEEKGREDEYFFEKYSNINIPELISHIKYFVSDMGTMDNDSYKMISESAFQEINIKPKFGPLSSMSELHLLPGWTDELIDLIKNEFSVYPNNQIDFNRISENMLRVLIPSLTAENIRNFYLWRDNPEKNQKINTLNDFKQYIVYQERIMPSADFDKRIELFQQNGITFGTNPNLFKIVSVGSFNRSTYTLVAFVRIPFKPKLSKKTQNNTTELNEDLMEEKQDSDNPLNPSSNNDDPPIVDNTNSNQPDQLLEPEIIEILAH